MKTKIGIVGTGYVGLVTGACLSKWHQVTCLDTDREKIELLEQGKAPFYEDALEEIIKSGLESGNLRFTRFFPELFEDSDVIFLCVGTPSAETGECDLTALMEISTKLSLQVEADKLVVIKSTVPPGTNDKVIQKINSLTANYHCASNPEFLREGTAVRDFLKPDRVVLGVRDAHSLNLLLEIYNPLDAEIFPVDVRSAELAKYASNAALAVKISYINEISNICEAVGANIEHVKDIMCSDKRIGDSFYQQGPGFGGSCFPKDLSALSFLAHENDQSPHVIDGTIVTNELQPLKVIDKIRKHFTFDQETTIAIWGGAFKAGTSDARHSIVIPVVKHLLEWPTVRVKIHDPEAIQSLKTFLPESDRISFYTTNPGEMSVGADVLVVATPWEEYQEVTNIGPTFVVDCWNILPTYDDKKYELFGS